MSKPVKAWHFMSADRRLANGDGRIVRKGATVTVDCEPDLCVRGLHASVRVIDALQYSPGPIICRVEVAGKIIHGHDKLVGTARKCLWWLDATSLLHEFACWCAESALRRANVTDDRCWNAIRVKLAWLHGEATDAQLAAAEKAARDAAWDAARDAAWDAARDAAVAAAMAAAVAAACYAAVAAACYAAVAAARDAAWDAQNTKLESMVLSAHRNAVRCGRSS